MAKSVLTRDLVSIPDVPQVELLGNGRVCDHAGIAEVELRYTEASIGTSSPMTRRRAV